MKNFIFKGTCPRFTTHRLRVGSGDGSHALTTGWGGGRGGRPCWRSLRGFYTGLINLTILGHNRQVLCLMHGLKTRREDWVWGLGSWDVSRGGEHDRTQNNAKEGTVLEGNTGESLRGEKIKGGYGFYGILKLRVRKIPHALAWRRKALCPSSKKGLRKRVGVMLKITNDLQC